nr:hypothetical protein [Tanacetum cinerariifolium]
MFWHTARDDPMFNIIRVISRHQDSQVYGGILPAELTNRDKLDSKAYKEYYAVASGVKPPKAKTKYKKKADESVTSPKSKTAFASKGTRLKSKDKVTKLEIKKKPAKKTKAKGLAVLSEAALSKAEQVKLVTKRSKTDFHISQASGLGVPDVPQYKPKSDKESWGDNDDEDDNDDNGDNDGDAESDDHDNDSDDERKESNNDEETKDDEEDDEVINDLYDDVNVNLGNGDTKMTDANQEVQNNKMFLRNQDLSKKKKTLM